MPKNSSIFEKKLEKSP